MFTSPIANMFTCLRNANLRRQRNVSFPYSRFKLNICQKLEKNNCLTECWADENKKIIKVKIKYFNQVSSIDEIKVTYKPSQQVYLNLSQIKKKCVGKRKIYLLTTSQGLLTHREAMDKKIGGKLIAVLLVNIWQ